MTSAAAGAARIRLSNAITMSCIEYSFLIPPRIVHLGRCWCFDYGTGAQQATGWMFVQFETWAYTGPCRGGVRAVSGSADQFLG